LKLGHQRNNVCQNIDNVRAVTAEIEAQKQLQKRLDNIIRHCWR